MQISDVLELLGIIIAVIAIISEKNRNYIFLKFNTCDIFIIALLFFHINYLIFYNWFRLRCDALSCFEYNHMPTSNTWSYFMTLFLLGFFVYKIHYAKFPKSNLSKVKKYFTKLLEEGEIIFLSKIIEDLYLGSVPGYLQKIKSFSPTISNKFPNQLYYEELSKKREEYLINNNLIYEAMIYNVVICDPDFIKSISIINPYYFTSILKELDNNKIQNEKIFYYLLGSLIKNKNRHLKRELFSNYSLGYKSSYTFDEESKIIKSITDNVKVASTNFVWKAIGEEAIKELNDEILKNNSLLRDTNIEHLNIEKEDYTVYWAIQFIDILVRAAIVQNAKDHMWMYYYKYFTKLLIKNLNENAELPTLSNKSTITFKIVEGIISTMDDWIELSLENELRLSTNIIECMGQVIWEIASSNKFDRETKSFLLNWAWEKFVNATILISEDDSVEIKAKKISLVKDVRSESIKTFGKPTILLDSPNYINESNIYKIAIKEAFLDRDIILYPSEDEEVIRYKFNVIDKF